MSSIKGLSSIKHLVPEAITTSFDAPLHNGYVESKFVAELLCDEVSRSLSVDSIIARVG